MTDQPLQSAPVLVLLGAGPPYSGEEASALRRTPGSRRVLDWILDAFADIAPEVQFVGGYHLTDIAGRYPRIGYLYNPEWAVTGSLGSLFLAPLPPDREHYVCYSDIVFRRDVAARLAAEQADVAIAIDRSWRHRYAHRSAADLRRAEKVRLVGEAVTAAGAGIGVAEADAEFVGLCRFAPRAVALARRLRQSSAGRFERQHLPALVEEFIAARLTVSAVDIQGQWAELNAPQDLAHFIVGTKAETLGRLKPLLKSGIIEEQVSFTAAEWKTAPDSCVDAICAAFAGAQVIVRSSSVAEDGWRASQAGAFLSVPGVSAGDPGALAAAIARVVDSYGEQNQDNQVLVQPMVTGAAIGGVAFTRTLAHGSPYYCINFDAASRRLDTVTSGRGETLELIMVHRDNPRLPRDAPALLGGLLPVLVELEHLIEHDSLDVEFAITADGVVHVLQLRPIAVERPSPYLDDSVEKAIAEAERRFLSVAPPSPFLFGAKPLFGIMPDWNPAEIIGTKPRRLAASLYQFLITDETWATQRAEFGYRDVRPQPLMVMFCGSPYVDVRASFNSFVPAVVTDDLAAKLVDHYLERLRTNPALHDKIEFEIAQTCKTFDFEQRPGALADAGFTRAEIEQLGRALAGLNGHAVRRREHELARLEALQRRLVRLKASRLSGLELAFALLDDCRRFGTLPFAHLARCAFIAVALLRSAARSGLIEPQRLGSYFKSMTTVTGQFIEHSGTDMPTLIERYGHLRPGTYEITSPKYADDPQRYLAAAPLEHPGKRAEAFSWSHRERSAVGAALDGVGLAIDFDTFDGFLRASISGREHAKFLFSRNVSEALDAIAAYGEAIGLGREQLSHVTIEDLACVRSGAARSGVKEFLQDRAAEGQAWHDLSQVIELPPLVGGPDDFRSFVVPSSQPNFVGRDVVVAEAHVLRVAQPNAASPAGKIVITEQADPGYDWLFGHAIAGLITAYGGANSHMTIRAAEIGLPAAIGVGQRLYEELCRARVVELDCRSRKVRAVR